MIGHVCKETRLYTVLGGREVQQSWSLLTDFSTAGFQMPELARMSKRRESDDVINTEADCVADLAAAQQLMTRGVHHVAQTQSSVFLALSGTLIQRRAWHRQPATERGTPI